MIEDSESMNESGIYRSMLTCCGFMALVFGALGISSFATVVGFSSGQTYLSLAGFVIATGALLLVVLRKQASGKSPVDADEAIQKGSQ